MKCRPDQSAPNAHTANQTSIAYQRSRSGIARISRRNATQAIAKASRNVA